jgi:phosphatidylserine/phosphatidylglycerophosphate/cardiolipin synthase-like enzyme
MMTMIIDGNSPLQIGSTASPTARTSSPPKKPVEKPSETPSAPVDRAEIGTSKAGPPPEIFVMKDGGIKTMVDAINGAQKNIDLKIYKFTPSVPELTSALKKALARGVDVRLMVEDDPMFWEPGVPNPSQKTVDELVKAGAQYKPDNPEFSKDRVTHEKTMTIDGKESIILTGNFNASNFNSYLDIGAIVVKNPQVVEQVEQVFNADWDRTPLPPLSDTGLVISPENAREKISGLIQGAGKNIQIIQQSLTDRDLLAVINDKVKEGVSTEILLTNPGVVQRNMEAAAFLATHGAKIRYLETPYVHAKAITVDTADSDHGNDLSFIGSQNFTNAGLDKNREMGFIFTDSGKQIGKIFDDYAPKGYEIPSRQLITDNYSACSSMAMAARLAEKSVVVETNIFSDKPSIGALTAAAKKGVKVQVLMPKNPMPWDPNCDFNIKTAEALKAGGVEVKWTDPVSKGVQGTVMLIDDKQVLSSSDSLTYAASSSNINFGVINIDPEDVREVSGALSSDWKGSTTSKPAGAASSGVVMSPQNARARLASLLQEAQKSINIETSQVSDSQMASILKAKAKAGVSVHITVADSEKMPDWQKKILDDLRASGASVEQLSYQPLKDNLIEVDGKKAYVGSHTLSKASLDETRGFGMIVDHPRMLDIGAKAVTEHFFTASIDQVQKTARVERKEFSFPSDRLMLDILKSRAKYGVAVEFAVGNPDCGDPHRSLIKDELKIYNKTLEDIARLDPVKDIDKIAAFYGLKFKPDAARAAHAKLVAAMKNLPAGKSLVDWSGKNPSSIKDDYIQVDDRKLPLPKPSEVPSYPADPIPVDISWHIAK